MIPVTATRHHSRIVALAALFTRRRLAVCVTQFYYAAMSILGNGESHRPRRTYSTAHGDLVFGDRCLVMGILNVTPDSFSDGGAYTTTKAAIRRAIEIVREGADIIDVGGESTRPGSKPIPVGEQIDRVVPVVRGARAAGVTVPISVDTRSADVAAAALDAGADIVNDISAARRLSWSEGEDFSQHESSALQNADAADNTEMLRLLADRDVPFIIMHMLGTPATMQKAPAYDDVVGEVGAFFEQRARKFAEAGVRVDGRMIVDPGIGFGKTPEHNLCLIRACSGYSEKWPVLLGTSRKRFIGTLLANVGGRDGPADAHDRLFGTAATVAFGSLTGVDLVRVHDVRAMRDVVEVCSRLRD